MADNATTMTASVRHCHLLSLLCELRNMILTILEPKDVARLVKTCKAFEQVARAMVWSECSTKGYKALAKMTAKHRKDHASKINSTKLEPGRRRFPTGRIALPYLENLDVKVQPRKDFKTHSFLSSTLKTLVIHDLCHRDFLSSLHKAISLEVRIDLCVVATLLPRLRRLTSLHLRVKLYGRVLSDLARIFEELGTMTDLQDLNICLATFSDSQPVSISHLNLAQLRGLEKLTYLKITSEVAKEGGRPEPYDLDLEDIDKAPFMSVLAGKKLECLEFSSIMPATNALIDEIALEFSEAK